MLASSLSPTVIRQERRTPTRKRQLDSDRSAWAIRGDLDHHFVIKYRRFFDGWLRLDGLIFERMRKLDRLMSQGQGFGHDGFAPGFSSRIPDCREERNPDSGKPSGLGSRPDFEVMRQSAVHDRAHAQR
jgi:hypothetical protein